MTLDRNKRISWKVVVEVSRPGPFREKDACRLVDQSLTHAQSWTTRIKPAKQFSRVLASERKRTTVVTVITTGAKDV